MESLLQTKNLEIKKINEEKKASMAAQFAAEATLRRVHASQKDDDMPPIEAVLAPLEDDRKKTANRVATVVANEWKDGNDKVMPVKQWLEERRFLQVHFVMIVLV
ncbi:unnamed protein product [Cochlearia groenlandica]